jgi:hypothetical protein
MIIPLSVSIKAKKNINIQLSKILYLNFEITVYFVAFEFEGIMSQKITFH